MSAPEELEAKRQMDADRRVLGVSVGATRGELKEGFYREAKKVHPDVFSQSGFWDGDDANAGFRRVREAYERLCAEEARARAASPPRGRSWRRTPGGLRPQPVGSMVGVTGWVLSAFVVALALNEASNRSVIGAFRARYGTGGGAGPEEVRYGRRGAEERR